VSSSQSLPRYQPPLPIVIALGGGIAANRVAILTGSGAAFALWWIVAIGCLAAWCWVWRGGRPLVSAWLLLLSIAAAGGAWHDLIWNLFPRAELSRYADFTSEPACVVATALASPQYLPAPPATPLRAIPASERSQIDVEVHRIRDGARWLTAEGHCRLTVDGELLGIAAGDEVQIFGQLRRPAPPMNPGSFDYAARARSEGRLTSLSTESPDCVTMLAAARHPTSWGFVESLRTWGQRTLATYVDRDQAGLASAVLLGIREELPYESTMPFFLTGTVHLLVVSGLNVAILATGLYALVWIGWLPRRVALALIVAVVAIYVLLAGAEPPVMRAGLLVVIFCVGAWVGRRGVAYNALAAAAIVVLMLDPTQLFHTGTQLSFLCVAILIWAGLWKQTNTTQPDPLDQLIAATRPWYEKASVAAMKWAWLLLVTSVAIWLVTLPLVLYRFHLASPIALLIAPIVWVLALVAMWSGFMTLACGFLLPIVAVLAGAICGVSLKLLVSVVNWAEAVPGGHFWAPGPAVWWLLGFYVGLLAIMFWGRRLLAVRWQVGLAALWIIVGLVPPIARHFSRGDELRCTFLSMGHGTCVVLETPDGQTLVYDAGSLGSPEFATDAVAGYLWDRGITRIDGLILSHADVDHYNAVPGLLERFSVGTVYVSPMMFDWWGATGPSDAPGVLHDAIKAAGVPLREVWSGDRLRVGEVALEVLHPPREGVIGSDNANSITLTVHFDGRQLLLPGDLETPGLEDVIAERPIDCDVLMAPHHGSRRSDPPGFAAWSTPEWVVLSGGADSDPEVENTYAAAGGKVLSTGKLGAVEFTLDRGGVTATSFRAAIPR
jgi:competence protein ComEC